RGVRTRPRAWLDDVPDARRPLRGPVRRERSMLVRRRRIGRVTTAGRRRSEDPVSARRRPGRGRHRVGTARPPRHRTARGRRVPRRPTARRLSPGRGPSEPVDASGARRVNGPMADPDLGGDVWPTDDGWLYPDIADDDEACDMESPFDDDLVALRALS